MKRLGVYLSWAIAISLTGTAILYYPTLEESFSKFVLLEHPEEKKTESKQESANEGKQEIAETNIVKMSDDQINKIGLEIQPVSPGKMTLTLSSRGKIAIDPNRQAHVIPKVTGIVKEAKKNIGDIVKAGEVIAILESQEMADLKASFLAATSKEKLAAGHFNRENSLFRKGISSELDYLNAKNSWEEAHINLQLASQKLRAFGLSQDAIALLSGQKEPDLRDYEIYAPIDGTVLMRHLTKGEFVDHQATIYEIADLSVVWIETVVYPKDLSRVQEGQTVEVVNLENLLTASARLTYLSPTIAEDTIAVKAIADLDNPHGEWRPGLFVNVNIATDKISVPLAINKDAVQKMDGCDCTFVQTEKGFEKREIKLGRSDNQIVEVLAGLMPGERYVSKNPFLIKAEMNKDSAKDED